MQKLGFKNNIRLPYGLFSKQQDEYCQGLSGSMVA